ncbi:MAG: PilZ domain-containing protein [Bryobacteraceae bacterium]
MKLTIVAKISGKQLDDQSPLKCRRVENRIPCNLSRVRITAEGDLATVEGQVVDVSKSGLRLRTDKYFPLARKVAVEMDGLLIRGSIRYRCVLKGNPGSFDMGLLFDE